MVCKTILLTVASVLMPTLVLAQDVVMQREPRPEFGAEQLVQLAMLVMALLLAIRGYRSLRRGQQNKRQQQEARRRRDG